MAEPDFAGWLPIRLYWQQSHPWVDWCYLGNQSLTEPFFDHAIDKALRKPFNLAFRRQTPIDSLLQLEHQQPGLTPNGFIFHMSRTGSTLVAQMLAALPQNIVLSEPGLLEALFRPEVRQFGITEEQQVTWLRALISMLGRPRRPEQTHYFIKFDSWHTVHLGLIRRAFPDVPWIFFYRNPEEVLVSLGREGGRRLVPGTIPPAELGLEWQQAFTLPVEEYHALVLARILDAALEYCDPAAACFLNYRQLPQAVWTTLVSHFGFDCTESDLTLMQERSGFDAKSNRKKFSNDTTAKQQAVSDAMRHAVDCWLAARFEKLERIRHMKNAPHEG